MKKILFTVMGVVLCLGLMGGAFAYFSDTETSTGNTFTAGTLIVSLDGEDNDGNPITSPFFTVGNMAPGDTATAYVEVENGGSLDMLFRVYVDDVTGTTDFADVLLATVTLHPSGYTKQSPLTPYGSPDNELASGIALSSIVGADNAMDNVAAAGETPPWPLKVGYVAVYEIVIELPSGTGDDWQAATLTGNLVVDAVQSANQDVTTPNVIWSSP